MLFTVRSLLLLRHVVVEIVISVRTSGRRTADDVDDVTDDDVTDVVVDDDVTPSGLSVALQIQCYQCEDERQDDCSAPDFIVNCTVNVQDMCQKEVLVMEDGERTHHFLFLNNHFFYIQFITFPCLNSSLDDSSALYCSLHRMTSCLSSDSPSAYSHAAHFTHFYDLVFVF